MARLVPRGVVLLMLILVAAVAAQAPRPMDWPAIEEETIRHFQAILRFDTTDPPTTPPGGEKPLVDYLAQVLQQEGISTEAFALEPNRPNLVARLRGNGRKRPLLLMAHTDVVSVDASKWTYPPFSATRNGGYVYGRGSVDDKDNVVAALMTLLLLKRGNVPLDRDLIVLFEAGEEGSTRVGIQFMVSRHLPAIDAEDRLAEGGNAAREGGTIRYVQIQTSEKTPYPIVLTARGTSGHGSVPLQDNAIVRVSKALVNLAGWQPPIRTNETTRAYFTRLASISSAERAQRYRNVLSRDVALSTAADAFFRANEPSHASMLRSSIVATIQKGGYRVNVIPSEASVTLDVRLLPDEDPAKFLEQVRQIVNDPAVDVAYDKIDVRPAGSARLGTEAFEVLEKQVTAHYNTVTLPTMSTGATDMSYLRAKGIQCYGMGPARDLEDSSKGFGAHSDQERILETELHRFVRFNFDVVKELVGSR